ncbi:MAG: exonuclease subunit SbcD [Planctomycetaceae bacterium]
MLKVLHTADWHLGQTFHGFDRDDEHGCFLKWLLGKLRDRRPDALIVAGDVFDTINPSAMAQRRLYSFLAAAHDAVPQLNIVLTAGNHDAGARLEAPRALLDSLNISVVGTVKRDDNGDINPQKLLVPLTDAAGNVKAIVMAVPFLRPSDVPLLPNADDAYLDGIRELYRMVTAPPSNCETVTVLTRL